MIMLYLRRFAGLTSFISKRCLSHFSSTRPSGTAPSSVFSVTVGSGLTFTCWVIVAIWKPLLINPAEYDRERHQNKAAGNDNGQEQTKRFQCLCMTLATGAESLKHAERAMVKMKCESDHRDHVKC